MARDWPYRRWLKSNGRPPTVPDLDLMDDAALRAWIAAVPRGTLTGEAAHAFPGKPPGYVRAYRLFVAIAHAKLKGRPWAEYYKRLPDWARWRDRFPVLACVRAGERFRKRIKRPNWRDLFSQNEREGLIPTQKSNIVRR